MLFQEIVLLFEQEATCIGSAFRNEELDHKNNRNTVLDSLMEQAKTSAGQNQNAYFAGEKAIVEGFRIICTGRLQMSPRSKPAEKAESVILNRGVLPLNSFEENIDFKQTYATNAYGTIGIKVWVNYVSRPSYNFSSFVPSIRESSGSPAEDIILMNQKKERDERRA
jgi:ribosomal protein S3